MGSGIKLNKEEHSILEMALLAQREHGYVTENDILAIAKEKGKPENEVCETISFYSMLRLTKPAPVLIEVCRGTSCYSAGNGDLLDELQRLTGCSVGETSADDRYQVEYVECLGHCESAPNVLVNGKLYTSVTKESLKEILKEVSEQ